MSIRSMKLPPLQDLDSMPFGEYRGMKMQEVPAKYLHGVYCNVASVPGKSSEQVIEYIERVKHALKDKYPDGIWRRDI